MRYRVYKSFTFRSRPIVHMVFRTLDASAGHQCEFCFDYINYGFRARFAKALDVLESKFKDADLKDAGLKYAESKYGYGSLIIDPSQLGIEAIKQAFEAFFDALRRIDDKYLDAWAHCKAEFYAYLEYHQQDRPEFNEAYFSDKLDQPPLRWRVYKSFEFDRPSPINSMSLSRRENSDVCTLDFGIRTKYFEDEVKAAFDAMKFDDDYDYGRVFADRGYIFIDPAFATQEQLIKMLQDFFDALSVTCPQAKEVYAYFEPELMAFFKNVDNRYDLPDGDDFLRRTDPSPVIEKRKKRVKNPKYGDIRELMTQTEVDVLVVYDEVRDGLPLNQYFHDQTLLHYLMMMISTVGKEDFFDVSKLKQLMNLLRLFIVYGAPVMQESSEMSLLEKLIDSSRHSQTPLEYFAGCIKIIAAAEDYAPHIFPGKKPDELSGILTGINALLEEVKLPVKPCICNVVASGANLMFHMNDGKSVAIISKKIHEFTERDKAKILTLAKANFDWQGHVLEAEFEAHAQDNWFTPGIGNMRIELIVVEGEVQGVLISEIKMPDAQSADIIYFPHIAIANPTIRQYQQFMSIVILMRAYAIQSLFPHIQVSTCFTAASFGGFQLAFQCHQSFPLYSHSEDQALAATNLCYPGKATQERQGIFVHSAITRQANSKPSKKPSFTGLRKGFFEEIYSRNGQSTAVYYQNTSDAFEHFASGIDPALAGSTAEQIRDAYAEQTAPQLLSSKL